MVLLESYTSNSYGICNLCEGKIIFRRSSSDILKLADYSKKMDTWGTSVRKCPCGKLRMHYLVTNCPFDIIEYIASQQDNITQTYGRLKHEVLRTVIDNLQHLQSGIGLMFSYVTMHSFHEFEVWKDTYLNSFKSYLKDRYPETVENWKEKRNQFLCENTQNDLGIDLEKYMYLEDKIDPNLPIVIFHFTPNRDLSFALSAYPFVGLKGNYFSYSYLQGPAIAAMGNVSSPVQEKHVVASLQSRDKYLAATWDMNFKQWGFHSIIRDYVSCLITLWMHKKETHRFTPTGHSFDDENSRLAEYINSLCGSRFVLARDLPDPLLISV